MIRELYRHGFDDADWRIRGDDAGELKIRFGEQGAVFGFGAFLALGGGEHGDVEHLTGVGRVAFGEHHFENEQAAGGGHGEVAVGEDDEALRFAPVVEDVGEQVEVAAAGDGFKEAAGKEVDAIGKAASSDQFRGGGLVVRKVEDNSVGAGVGGEEGGEDVAGGSADVGDVSEGREIIGGSDGGRVGAVEADEQVREPGRFFGLGGEIFKKWHTEVGVEGGLAGEGAVVEAGPGDGEEGSGEGEDGVVDGAGNIGLERLSEGVEREAVVFVFGEDADRSEGAQEAIERGRVRVGENGELAGGLGAVGEVIGKTQLHGGAKQIGGAKSHGHLHELGLRGLRLRRFGI